MRAKAASGCITLPWYFYPDRVQLGGWRRHLPLQRSNIRASLVCAMFELTAVVPLRVFTDKMVQGVEVDCRQKSLDLPLPSVTRFSDEVIFYNIVL